MLDPIADKLLVGATLLMLVYDRTISGWSIWAAVIILSREILVSGLREFLAELNVKIHVTQLAKWKTTFQFIALAMLLAGPAAQLRLPGLDELGMVILVDFGTADAGDRLRLSQSRHPPRHRAVTSMTPPNSHAHI